MQKAYRELERQGYVYTTSGVGTFVADKAEIRADARELEAAMCLPEPPEEQAPEAFRGLTGPEALARAQADLEAARRPRGKAWLPVGIAALGVGLVLGLILPGAWKAVALGAGLPGIAFLVVGLVRRPAAGEGLMARYGTGAVSYTHLTLPTILLV